MRFRTFTFYKQIQTLYSNRSRQYNSLVIENIFPKRHHVKRPVKLTSIVCVYSSDNKKHLLDIDKQTDALKNVLEQRKIQIKDTEQRLRQKSVEIVRDLKQQRDITGQKFKLKKEHLVKDILETKAKVREKIEEVVEV